LPGVDHVGVERHRTELDNVAEEEGGDAPMALLVERRGCQLGEAAEVRQEPVFRRVAIIEHDLGRRRE